MLGWFKKKFTKKDALHIPAQDPQQEQQSVEEPPLQEIPPAPAPPPEPQQDEAPAPRETAAASPPPTSASMFKRLSERLSKTRDSFIYRMDTLFLGKKVIDTELLDELEELLITADLGIGTTTELLDHARRRVKRKELSDPALLREVLRE